MSLHRPHLQDRKEDYGSPQKIWLYRGESKKNEAPQRLYGLPKIHKKNVSRSLIVNCIGSSTYYLAKHLAQMLSPTVGLSEHHTRNTQAFVQKFHNMNLHNTDILVRFDVVSLFTKVKKKKVK
jgi:translation initiation factor RLI1